MQRGQTSEGRFINSTGVWIQQLYKVINYKVPGKIYPSISFNRKQSHSLINYAHRLISFLLSIQLKNLISSITFQKRPNLHSVYKKESLAILSNSSDLHSAICKAQEYNIPLFQVVILTKEGQQAVRQKLLVNFAISHFINQNFVLYGDWEKRQEIFDCLQIQEEKAPYDSRQGIYLRKGELIYAFISLQILAKTDQSTLQQNLIKVRNMFYLFQNQKQCRIAQPQPDFSPQLSSDLEPQLSNFGVLGTNNNYEQQRQQAQEFIDNFNDSDNQMELQP